MYKLNSDGTYVNKIGTGEWHSVSSSAEYLAWLADGNTPEPADPLPPPVYTCSPWQIRKALNAQGLRQSVEDAVSGSDDQTLKDGWEFATSFQSDYPFVISMGASLGMTEEQTADLIQYASTL
jgi:hypothetical protein